MQLTDHFTEAFDDAQDDGTRAHHLLRLDGERRKSETDTENDREPDQDYGSRSRRSQHRPPSRPSTSPLGKALGHLRPELWLERFGMSTPAAHCLLGAGELCARPGDRGGCA